MYLVLKGLLKKILQSLRFTFLAALPYVIPLVAFAQGDGGSGGAGGGGGAGEWLSNAASWLTSPFAVIIAEIMQWVFFLVNWLTSILGQIMNWTIEFFILNMSEKINQITAIDSLWQILRDLGNIVFIFLILYAAISTILDSNEYGLKNLLPRIIVVALLVNFSLFFTQLIIDISNVFTIQIYENISVSGIADSSGVNISNAIADQLNLSSIMGDGATEWFGSGGQNSKVAIFRAIGAVVVGIVGFIYLAFAALITIRFFVLILLMIASPIAFIAFALPNVDFGETWINYLISQSFFAPAMMLMLYITLYLGKNMKEGEAFSDGNISEAITEPSGNIDILIFYALMIGMLLASLIVARRMGAAGADKTVDYGKSAGAYVGGSVAGGAAYASRSTIGRGGRRVADIQTLKDWEKEGGLKGYIGQQARRSGSATAGSSFDVRNTGITDTDSGAGYREGGFDEQVKEQKEFRKGRKKSLGELSPEEKERASKARLEKERAQNLVEEEKERLNDKKSAIDENLDRDTEKIQDDIEDINDDISNLDESFNDAKQTVNDELQRVDSAIQKRKDLETELVEARDEGNTQKANNIQNRLDSLTDNISGVDDRNNLEDRKTQLEDRKHSVQSSYKERKRRLQQQKEQLEGDIDDLKTQAEDRKNAIEREASRLDDTLEKREKQLDKIIKIGEEREEEYVEQMMEQQSLLDNVISEATGERTEITTKTQGNREMAREELENVDDEDRRHRIKDLLGS